MPKLKIQPGPSDSVATFIFEDEDHTLGNSLKHVLLKNENVEFCGYSVPHPLENKMNVHVQTNSIPATEAVEQGLDTTIGIAEHILDEFNNKVEQYKSS